MTDIFEKKEVSGVEGRGRQKQEEEERKETFI